MIVSIVDVLRLLTFRFADLKHGVLIHVASVKRWAARKSASRLHNVAPGPT